MSLPVQCSGLPRKGNRGEINRITFRLQKAFADNASSDEVMMSQPEALFDIDKRASTLMEHIQKCRETDALNASANWTGDVPSDLYKEA